MMWARRLTLAACALFFLGGFCGDDHCANAHDFDGHQDSLINLHFGCYCSCHQPQLPESLFISAPEFALRTLAGLDPAILPEQYVPGIDPPPIITRS